MSLVVKKMNDSFYRLLIKKNKKTTMIKKDINNVKVPYGLEEYKGKYLVNFELSNEKDIELINLIKLLENKIKDIFGNQEIKIKKILKETKDGVLVKGNVKKTKNVIVTKYFANNEEKPIFDLSKNSIVKLSLELSGIWKFKNTCGLFINIKTIRSI